MILHAKVKGTVGFIILTSIVNVTRIPKDKSAFYFEVHGTARYIVRIILAAQMGS